MGIFSDSSEQDIQTLSYIVDASLAAYASQHAKRPGITDYEITPNDRLEYISDAGGRILELIGLDDALIRAATLLVLSNAAPPFSLKKHGKLCLDFAARKDFLSRFTCLLVHAALSTMEVDRGLDTFILRWHAFPDEHFSERFLTYLQLVEGFKVDPGTTEKQRKQSQEAYFKILAHLSLGCALALQSCVREEKVDKPPQLSD